MIKDKIRQLVSQAAAEAGYDVPAVFNVDVPKREFGDLSTNIALMIGQSRPELISSEIADNLVVVLRDSDLIEQASVAGPGFINLTIARQYYLDELKMVLKLGENYGQLTVGEGKKLQVEHVSANPTGPLHVGNARGGPLGEALANIHKFAGYDAATEFYINDIGGQINRFAESLYYWYAVKEDSRIVFPEGGYQGDFIKNLSEEIQSSFAAEIEELKEKDKIVELFKREGLKRTIEGIKQDCALIDVKFDNWVFQSEVQGSGKSAEAIKKLKETGSTVKKEGALWFKSPADTELNDRESVLEKSDEAKTLTYFADDIAYHVDKFARGFTKVIDVWGSNHHGHVPRLKAAVGALGVDANQLEIILYQYVRLKRGDEIVKMAKRAGTYVTLRQVIEAGVAPDAFKYFILNQNPQTPIDFDLELAKDTSEKNPVFYIKYAHARIASILRKANQEWTTNNLTTNNLTTNNELIKQADLSLLSDEKELILLKELTQFPELIAQVLKDYQVQSLCHYAYRVATLFHDFYTNCQVLSENKATTEARLALIIATKTILKTTLGLLNISAPEKM